MAVRHEQKAVEEGTSASEAAALEQERRMLYCLGQVPSLGAVSIQELGEFFGGFSNLFNNSAQRKRDFARRTNSGTL